MSESADPIARNPDSKCDRTPIGLLAELTHRCPFQCPYCSNPVELEKVDKELDTNTWLSVFDQAADLGILQVHLSGGEPTVRRDLEDIVKKCAERGLYSNLITAGGPSLTRERLEKLADVGIDHVQVSIDDVETENANKIGGFKRGHETKVELIKWVKELDLPLTINVPFHRHNIDNRKKLSTSPLTRVPVVSRSLMCNIMAGPLLIALHSFLHMNKPCGAWMLLSGHGKS